MNDLLDAHINESIGDFHLDVSLRHGREIGVLFGPSGSGKSVTLRCLAGLRNVRSGRISLAGRVLLDSDAGICEPPHRRKMGLLFQDLALFPHLTALENVLFGCERTGKGRAKSIAREWLARVRLESLEDRYPSQLSGGQRQRVALARALANEPEMLMLDEPFSALDGPLRRNLRRELRKLHAETGVPILYVTHQVEDICALGDKVFFIENGKTTGSNRISDLIRGRGRVDLWKMMGWGNIFEGNVRFNKEGVSSFHWASGELSLKDVSGSGPAIAFVRPDRVRFLDPRMPVDSELSRNTFSGKIEEVLLDGGAIRLHVRTPCGHWQIEQRETGSHAEVSRPGQEVHFAIPPRAVELIFLEEMKGDVSLGSSIVEVRA
ncbi:MAG TPA: ABC transporter [Synergistaceae bacterium]|nr:MAG: ABC transporter related protein [Synergistales bacterium 57_84]KUK88583.1 MAG: ABC transporter related protein [Synergistales bacterium 58_81]HBG14880.1 ABC transporter [Synergistaceae bacterium]HCP08096.1 ABC transporter [Synergistaceae bacterium]